MCAGNSLRGEGRVSPARDPRTACVSMCLCASEGLCAPPPRNTCIKCAQGQCQVRARNTRLKTPGPQRTDGPVLAAPGPGAKGSGAWAGGFVLSHKEVNEACSLRPWQSGPVRAFVGGGELRTPASVPTRFNFGLWRERRMRRKIPKASCCTNCSRQSLRRVYARAGSDGAESEEADSGVVCVR